MHWSRRTSKFVARSSGRRTPSPGFRSLQVPARADVLLSHRRREGPLVRRQDPVDAVEREKACAEPHPPNRQTSRADAELVRSSGSSRRSCILRWAIGCWTGSEKSCAISTARSHQKAVFVATCMVSFRSLSRMGSPSCLAVSQSITC